jgi:isopentenyl phosphate kinase
MGIKIIKLGGSVITDKTKPFVFRSKKVSRIGKILAEYKSKVPNDKLILVHGAGSFGHPLAKEFELQAGWIEGKTSLGIAKTTQAVRVLNTKLMKELGIYDLPLFTVSPSGLGLYGKGVDDFGLKTEFLDQILDCGLIPVLHGDVMLGTKPKTFGIVSGDVLIKKLGMMYGKEAEIIMIGDTKGVLDKEGNTIETITKNNLNNLKEVFVEHHGIDVTGGMYQKILETLEVAHLASKVLIMDIDELEKFLGGTKKYTATTIK